MKHSTFISSSDVFEERIANFYKMHSSAVTVTTAFVMIHSLQLNLSLLEAF
jgi:hypothetical protein